MDQEDYNSQIPVENQKMDQEDYNSQIPVENQKKERHILIIVIIIASLFVFGGALFYFSYNPPSSTEPLTLPEKRADYLIPGVHPLTIYSEETINSALKIPVAAAEAMVLEYWGLKPEYGELSDNYLPLHRSVFYQEVVSHAVVNMGMIAYIDELKTPQDLKKYINNDIRTPLITRLNLTPETPETQWVVVIGVSEKDKKITVHNFFFGSNYEISLSDWERFQNTTPDVIRNLYIVIQPSIDRSEIIARLPQNPEPYTKRSIVEDKLAEVMIDYVKGERSKDPETKVFYYKRALIDNPNAEKYMATWQRVVGLSFYGVALVKTGEFEEAKRIIDLAESLNHDLDTKEEGWEPHVSGDKMHDPWYAYGIYYSAIGDEEEARKWFELNDLNDPFRHDIPN